MEITMLSRTVTTKILIPTLLTSALSAGISFVLDDYTLRNHIIMTCAFLGMFVWINKKAGTKNNTKETE